jgi:gas vesicle protein
VLGAGFVHAQGTRQPARSPEVQQRIAQAKQRLQLTPEQETKLRALLQEEAQKLRAIRDKYANDTTLQGRGARSRELQAVQEDLRGKLQTVLSPAQLDEWDRMAAERRAQARERRQQQP